MSIGFWSIETYQNSMPLFDWISSILLWKIAFRIFFGFNYCKKYRESVHKVFRWILNCKFCVMKLILRILMKTASSWSWGNDVSFNGAILDLMKRRLVLFGYFLGIIDRFLFPMPYWKHHRNFSLLISNKSLKLPLFDGIQILVDFFLSIQHPFSIGDVIIVWHSKEMGCKILMGGI